jgi:hypothetical protein
MEHPPGLAIPPISSELDEPVRALVRASTVLHKMFLLALDGQDPHELVRTHKELLLLCETIVGRWRDHLGMDVEELLNDV